jgi:hypothetical protein
MNFAVYLDILEVAEELLLLLQAQDQVEGECKRAEVYHQAKMGLASVCSTQLP